MEITTKFNPTSHDTQNSLGQGKSAGQTVLILEHNMGACLPAFRGKKGFLKKDTKSQKKKKVIYMKTLKLGTCVRQLQERKDKEEHPIATHTISSRLVSRSCQHVQGEVSIAQSCLALCDPMDCSPPGSSVCGILQARTLEWVPFPSPGESS